jgi:hypothetical protein
LSQSPGEVVNAWRCQIGCGGRGCGKRSRSGRWAAVNRFSAKGSFSFSVYLRVELNGRFVALPIAASKVLEAAGDDEAIDIEAATGQDFGWRGHQDGLLDNVMKHMYTNSRNMQKPSLVVKKALHGLW